MCFSKTFSFKTKWLILSWVTIYSILQSAARLQEFQPAAVRCSSSVPSGSVGAPWQSCLQIFVNLWALNPAGSATAFPLPALSSALLSPRSMCVAGKPTSLPMTEGFYARLCQASPSTGIAPPADATHKPRAAELTVPMAPLLAKC